MSDGVERRDVLFLRVASSGSLASAALTVLAPAPSRFFLSPHAFQLGGQAAAVTGRVHIFKQARRTRIPVEVDRFAMRACAQRVN